VVEEEVMKKHSEKLAESWANTVSTDRGSKIWLNAYDSFLLGWSIAKEQMKQHLDRLDGGDEPNPTSVK
jgi:hypothetical protein